MSSVIPMYSTRGISKEAKSGKDEKRLTAEPRSELLTGFVRALWKIGKAEPKPQLSATL